MKTVHPVLICAALLAAGIGLSLLTGCSCDDSEPPEAGVVVVAKPKPAEAAPQAPAAPKEKPPSAGGGGSMVGEMLGAPGAYYGTVTIKAPRYARKTVTDSVLTHDIHQYRAMHDQFPPSLEALAEWSGRKTPAPPKGYAYEYDPATGNLQVVEKAE